MLDYLSQLFDFNVFILLNVILIPISIITIIVVNKYIPLALRAKHNVVLGYTSSLISLIYGVLVGLTALYLFNINGYTADAVQREANTVADLYRDSKWLKPPIQVKIQAELQQYLTEVIDMEWPLMQNGQLLGHYGDHIINKMMGNLMTYQGNNPLELQTIYNMLDGLKVLYDARHQRIHMS